MELPLLDSCPVCHGSFTVERLACGSCGCSLEGEFKLPRLARLTRKEQQFIEMFVTLSGNLKKMASALEVSYPTIRSRLDDVIASLEMLTVEDQARSEELIDAVERNEIPAALAARILEEG